MTKLAAIQMVSGANVDDNLSMAAGLIADAVAQGATIILLPENFALMGEAETDKLTIGEDFAEGPLQDFLSHQAKEQGVYLIGGTLPIRSNDPNKVRATSLVFDPRGECIGRYDKIHLFDVTVSEGESYKESDAIQPGDEVVTVKIPSATLGLSVCYDLRFPELYRQLTQAGAEILFVPSAFTQVTGQAHWESLLRARAIENQAYIVAANQGGEHPNHRHTYGHTMIIDPWGTIVGCLDKGPGVIVIDYDADLLKQKRLLFPTLKHRKL